MADPIITDDTVTPPEVVTLKLYDDAGGVTFQKTEVMGTGSVQDDTLPPELDSYVPASDSLVSFWQDTKNTVASLEEAAGNAAGKAVSSLTNVAIGIGVLASLVVLIVYAPEVKAAIHFLKGKLK